MSEEIPDAEVLEELKRRERTALLRSIARDSARIERERIAQHLESFTFDVSEPAASIARELAAVVRRMPDREGL